jgi:hypothetical protein
MVSVWGIFVKELRTLGLVAGILNSIRNEHLLITGLNVRPIAGRFAEGYMKVRV